MNSIYVPTQVVVLLKRLANVVGAFGISNQYLLHRQAKADERPAKVSEDVTAGRVNPKGMAWQTLAGLKYLEWLSWPSRSDWQRARNVILDKWTTVSRDTRNDLKEGLLRGSTSISLASHWTKPADFVTYLSGHPVCAMARTHSFMVLNTVFTAQPQPQ
jgi:triacylglycerol lipase